MCIALFTGLALALITGGASAQEHDAPANEEPTTIDIPALTQRRHNDPLADFLFQTERERRGPVAQTTDESDEFVNTSFFLQALTFGALVVVIIALFVAVVLLVVGTAVLTIAVALTVLAGAAALTLGLASTSTFVAASRRSFGAGFEALLAQTGAIAGLPCGVALSWIAYSIARDELALDVSRNVSLTLGGLSGLAVGAALGLLTARAVRLTTAWVRAKLSPPSPPSRIEAG
jgi:hypothetical protein